MTQNISTLQLTPARRRWVLFLILVPVFVGALDLTIVSAILPEVLTRLNIPVDSNLGTAAWAVTGYLLAYTVSMLIMGRISDLVGRRNVYLACLVIFILGSWWVASAAQFPTDLFNTIARQYLQIRPPPNENQLTLLAVIVGRVIQAFGAGAMVPVSMALIGDLYPPEQRSAPIGLIGALDTAGWVLGHLYGGLMVKWFNDYEAQFTALLSPLGMPTPNWKTLFILNVPIGVIAFVLTWLALRGVPENRTKGRFDLIGAILVSSALIGLSVSLGGNTEVTGSTSLSTLTENQPAPFNLGLLIASGVTFALFIVWEWRSRDPLIDLRLFRKRNVSAASGANLLVGFCLMLGLVSVPLLINLRAQSADANAIAQAAQDAGILLSGLTIPMALVAVLGGSVSNRIGYRATVCGGLILAGVGLLWAGLTWNATTPPLLMVTQMGLVGIGLGLTVSPVGTAVINAADESQRGVASALVIILRLVGMTLAISSLTSFALSRVNQLVAEARLTFPPGVTPIELERLNVTAYFNSGIRAIDELLIIGAVACVIAVIPALFMRGGIGKGSAHL
jgi:MFS family permease